MTVYSSKQTHNQKAVSLYDYMARCLENYYQKKPTIIGGGGDFITAPEISQMFGELIGLWFVEQYHRLGKPKKFYLIELGPGRGTLMEDFLRVTPEHFKRTLSLHFVEVNPFFIKEQSNKFNQYSPVWHQSVDDMLDSINEDPAPILCLANEFLDTFPIRQFKGNHDRWLETFVLLNEKGHPLRLIYEETSHLPPTHPQPEEGKIWEYNPSAVTIIKKLGHGIAMHEGAGLFIDYGYVHNTTSTLQALKNHKKIDNLTHDGEADITAHVDFGLLSHVLSDLNLHIFGPQTQGKFLYNLGLHVRGQQLIAANTNKNQKKAKIFSDIYRLTSPSQMGELFKVLAFTDKKNTGCPSGF